MHMQRGCRINRLFFLSLWRHAPHESKSYDCFSEAFQFTSITIPKQGNFKVLSSLQNTNVHISTEKSAHTVSSKRNNLSQTWFSLLLKGVSLEMAIFWIKRVTFQSGDGSAKHPATHFCCPWVINQNIWHIQVIRLSLMPVSRGSFQDPLGREVLASRIQKQPEVQLNRPAQQLALLSRDLNKYLMMA